jgi:hypothetical protein
LRADPWRQVAQTLTAIRSKLKEDDRSIRYLQSFARQRLGMDKADIEAFIPTGKQPEVEVDLQNHRLVQLQAALVRATMCLTAYFGRSFAEHTPSVHQLREAWVPFEILDIQATEAVDALFDAVNVAQELHRSPQESPFLDSSSGIKREIRFQRIHEKLLTLILMLVPLDQVSLVQRFRPHQHTLEKLPDIFRELKGSDRRLRLDAVQWLSELIWYTLRYWVPRYPTTAELAFELSLGVKDAPVRRAELAQAALALSHTENLDQEIRALLKYCEHGQEKLENLDREAAAFFYAIAAAIQHQFDLFQDTLVASDPMQRYKGRGAKSREGSGGTPLPLVFTTNFDKALEGVFKQADLPYHVVFPIVPGGAGAADRPSAAAEGSSIVWIMRTYFAQKAGAKAIDEKWEDICPPGDEPRYRFRGPVFVKLHGSPSEDLPDENDQHWLVLSEEGYLQALSDKHRMPEWLGGQLHASYASHARQSDPRQKHRSVWFLGYSLSDWNVRLHLYQQARLTLGFRSTVDRDDDVYRMAILNNLEVHQWVGDLNRFPTMIASELEDDKFPTSVKVDGLIAKVRTLMQE